MHLMILIPELHQYIFVCLHDTLSPLILFFFFFNDTATTEIYTLSLHDALPISAADHGGHQQDKRGPQASKQAGEWKRSEEHTSELQSPCNLVCRLLLEKKKTRTHILTDVLTTNSSILTPLLDRHVTIEYIPSLH